MATGDSKEEFIFVDNAITVQDSSVEKPLNIERPSGLMKKTYYGRGQRSNSIGIYHLLNRDIIPTSIQCMHCTTMINF